LRVRFAAIEGAVIYLRPIPESFAPSPRLRSIAALPAVAMLAFSPAAAAQPGHMWVELCGRDGRVSIPLTSVPGNAPDDRQHASCAHATCPREDRLEREARNRI
jgi:hypothetical protein